MLYTVHAIEIKSLQEYCRLADGTLNIREKLQYNSVADARSKGQFHEIFVFTFFHELLHPPPLSILLGRFRIILKIHGDFCSSRCTTSVKKMGGKWKKKFTIKVYNIQFGHHWKVELTYRQFFFFKFTLRCWQSDIVPIISNRCQRQHRTVQIYHRCC